MGKYIYKYILPLICCVAPAAAFSILSCNLFHFRSLKFFYSISSCKPKNGHFIVRLKNRGKFAFK